MDSEGRDWHVKWLGSWALVVTMIGSILLAAAYANRKPSLVLGTSGNVSFEQALTVLVRSDNLSQRLSAQAILLERLQAAIRVLRSPRTTLEAEAAEAILRHLHEDTAPR